MVFGELLTAPVVRAVRHSLTLQFTGMAFVGRILEGETSASRATARHMRSLRIVNKSKLRPFLVYQ
jgi:hypothetical protein